MLGTRYRVLGTEYWKADPHPLTTVAGQLPAHENAPRVNRSRGVGCSRAASVPRIVECMVARTASLAEGDGRKAASAEVEGEAGNYFSSAAVTDTDSRPPKSARRTSRTALRLIHLSSASPRPARDRCPRGVFSLVLVIGRPQAPAAGAAPLPAGVEGAATSMVPIAACVTASN